MGKKVTNPQAKSLKTTNKNHHHESSNDNKKQLNSLIKVLRPKVYITDRANFKKLVQELTGNGTGTGSGGGSSRMQFPASYSGRTEAVIERKNNIPVIEIIEDDDDGDKQASMEVVVEANSFDASFDSLFDEGLFREVDNQMYLNDVKFDDIWSMNQLGEDCLASSSYQDIESWLLDVDHQPCPSINGFEQNQEVNNIYDYELSRLI